MIKNQEWLSGYIVEVHGDECLAGKGIIHYSSCVYEDEIVQQEYYGGAEYYSKDYENPADAFKASHDYIVNKNKKRVEQIWADYFNEEKKL